MSWIQTCTGKKFDLFACTPDQINIGDIAHSLSMQCRFNGHCREFYSIAQHSVHVAELLPEGLKLWGLLHDAAEAYIGDIVRPLKRELFVRKLCLGGVILDFPPIKSLEARIMQIVAAKFRLPWPPPKDIADADNVMLATELKYLMEDPPEPWETLPQPLDQVIVPWGHYLAKREFMATFYSVIRKDP